MDFLNCATYFKVVSSDTSNRLDVIIDNVDPFFVKLTFIKFIYHVSLLYKTYLFQKKALKDIIQPKSAMQEKLIPTKKENSNIKL